MSITGYCYSWKRTRIAEFVLPLALSACAPIGDAIGGDRADAASPSTEGRDAEHDGGNHVPRVDAAFPPREAGAADASTPDMQRDAAPPSPDADAGTPSLGAQQTWVPDPSWTCGLPDGVPPPQLGRLIFEAELELGAIHDMGETQYGQRTLIEVRGGSFEGPEVRGSFLERGLDLQLMLSTGAVELEGVHILRTSEGAHVYVRSCGISPSGTSSARVAFDFEAPSNGEVAFLNRGVYVGLREFDAAAKSLAYKVYDVAGVQAPERRVNVVEPDDVPDQSYDCKALRAQKGATVYTASVTIGAGSVRVGASKRGTRNIIPITGGTVSGRLAGTVLNGGADYQLSQGGSLTLDARYTLRMTDGTLILVRNCGPASALVPVYETTKGSAYEWINQGSWLSSSPQISIGAVILTTYEAT